jgi:hypothetical protein
MKKLLSMSLLLVAAMAMLITSCKKSSTSNPAGSGSLGAGKSSISFNSSANYAGSTSFSQSNTALTSAQTLSSSSLRNVSLSASEVSGTSARLVTMTLILPADASTTGGNINGDFSQPNGATFLPTLTLTSSSGATQGITYAAETGTCTITKLTATEVEGTFSGTVKDINGTATLSISNGTFAGKF